MSSRSPRLRLKPPLTAALLAAVSGAFAATPLAQFIDRRDPPSYRALDEGERALFELGIAVFNTQWVPAGTPRAERRDGLGPLFNAASCDACHNNGARIRGPLQEGLAPASLVIQLRAREGGPSVLGHVLNTAAIAGHEAEGVVRLRFTERVGRYPDGQAWTLREPVYDIRLNGGNSLSPETVIGPRIAPAVFGAGLLDAVPAAAITDNPGKNGALGRFGWQGGAVSLEQQTAHAFSREMGLTTALVGHDDCAAADTPCREAPLGGEPEVSAEFMSAVLAFQRWVAVPSTPGDGAGAKLFKRAGCVQCHLPQLPVEGVAGITAIAAYTDLRLHDLGEGLADRDAEGRVIASRWRTAPLWGLGHALRSGDGAALLHDGRARNVEEAVLWHDGEAAPARQSFEKMSAVERERLLDWVGRR